MLLSKTSRRPVVTSRRAVVIKLKVKNLIFLIKTFWYTLRKSRLKFVMLIHVFI